MGDPDPPACRVLDDGPAIPWHLEHLVTWARQLRGRSGVDPMGNELPLSYAEFRAWRLENQIGMLEAYEIRMLFDIDRTMLNPQPMESP